MNSWGSNESRTHLSAKLQGVTGLQLSFFIHMATKAVKRWPWVDKYQNNIVADSCHFVLSFWRFVASPKRPRALIWYLHTRQHDTCRSDDPWILCGRANLSFWRGQLNSQERKCTCSNTTVKGRRNDNCKSRVFGYGNVGLVPKFEIWRLHDRTNNNSAKSINTTLVIVFVYRSADKMADISHHTWMIFFVFPWI